MPPILIPVPNREDAFIRFPEGTTDREIRVYLGTKEAGSFPDIRTSLVEERTRSIKLGKSLEKLKSSPFQIGSLPFEALTRGLGVARGAIGALLQPEIAEEEFGEAFNVFGRPEDVFFATLGMPPAKDPQVALQELIGNPRLPFTDKHIFPMAPPPFVDELTGENKELQFQSANLRRSFREHITKGAIGMLATGDLVGLDKILPPDERGFPFELHEPRGFLETSSASIASLFGRTPEFWVGGQFGQFIGTGLGRGLVLTPLTAQRTVKLSALVGAFSYASYLDDIIETRITLGKPSNYSESIERVISAVEEAGKGAVTGLALAAGQTVGGAVFGRAFGIPAGALPSSSLRAALAQGAGTFVGGTAVFGTVPQILEGELPTVEGYYDAAVIMGLFAIGEGVLARQLVARPDADAMAALRQWFEQRNIDLPLLPPPPSQPPPLLLGSGERVYFFPKTTPRLLLEMDELIPLERRLGAPDPSTISEGRGFTMEGRQEGAIAPAEAPVRRPGVPTAFEQQVEGSNLEAIRRVQQTEEAQKASDFADRIQELQKVPDLQKFLPSPDVDFTLPGMEPTQPVAGPVKRPALGVTGDVAPAPIGRNEAAFEALEVLRQRRVAAEAEFQRGFDEGIEGIATVAERLRPYRDYQQANDLARKTGLEEKPIERGAQIEFDIEGIRRDARSDAEALDALVRDLAVIEGKETPEAIFEATARVSELSGEAISLREAEARNIARQIADSDLVAPGESITAVLGIDEAAQSIRVRLRDNTGDVETLDMPIGVIKGVPELIEAHRRAEASIEAAVEGRRVEAKESGALDRVRQRLMSELERLKNEELGAFRNPFSRKSTKPKTEADEYVAPYIEQTSRARLFEELSKINKARDTNERILRKPDLTKKQRAKAEMLAALLREQQIKFAQAANAAPFVVVDPRAELNARPFNAVRAIAKRERISIGKHPTKSDLIEEIIVRRSRVKGQLSSPLSGIDLAKSAEKKLNDELMARDERLDALGKRALDFVGRNINPTHTILDGLKQLRREHPDQYLPLIERAYVETELIRTAPSTGFEIYRKRMQAVYGQLSRSEKVLFDKMYRARADIALKEIDPAIQGTLEVMEAKEYLKHHRRQDPAAFSKISARIDLMRDLYKDGLEAAVEEGSYPLKRRRICAKIEPIFQSNIKNSQTVRLPDWDVARSRFPALCAVAKAALKSTFPIYRL